MVWVVDPRDLNDRELAVIGRLANTLSDTISDYAARYPDSVFLAALAGQARASHARFFAEALSRWQDIEAIGHLDPDEAPPDA